MGLPKYCTNCGAKIEDENSRFCTECGSPLEGNNDTEPVKAAAVKNTPEKKKMLVKIIIGIFIVFACTGIAYAVKFLFFKGSSIGYPVKFAGGNVLYINKSRLNSDFSTNIILYGEYLYYKNVDDGHKIYKIKTDSSARSKLNDDYSQYISAAE